VKRIEITVTPDGRVRVETHGFSGSDCRLASQFLETALGTVAEERLKPEFHVQTDNSQQLRQSSDN